jgi:hypothetical protein
MRTSHVLTLALASVASAIPDFAIGIDYITAKDSAQLSSMTAAYLSAISSFQASMTAQPQWSSAFSALKEYQMTGKNVPDEVTATDAVLTYATTPDW